MTMTRPLSDLSQRTEEISLHCRKSGEPVFITQNGQDELVVMSIDAYEQSQARLELYQLLDEAEEDFRNGDRGGTVAEMRERLAK